MSGAMSPDASGWGYQEEDTNFSLGQYAMAIDGPWMRNYALQNPKTMADVKIVPPPGEAVGRRPSSRSIRSTC